MKIKAELEISEKRIASLLCGAFEGGSGYWCGRVYAIKGGGAGYHSDLIASGKISVFGVFDREGERRIVCRTADLKKGLEIMAEKYPRHFADFLSEQGDATTDDVYFQCVVFGEAIYG